MKIFNLFPKAKKETPNKGLSNTKPSLFDKLSKVFLGKSTIDYEVLDQLEESLIAADVGVETTVKIIQQLEARVAKDQYLNTKAFHTLFTEALTHLFPVNNQENFTVPIQQQPYVILVVGVNGVGKTTTIGKLAAKYKQHGKKVLLGAADTFRAAAVTQIEQWGKRVGVPVVNHGMHTDPASVAYDVVKQGIDTHTDVVIIDTAGRLHNQVNLMNALTKMKRVVQKLIPEAQVHQKMLYHPIHLFLQTVLYLDQYHKKEAMVQFLII